MQELLQSSHDIVHLGETLKLMLALLALCSTRFFVAFMVLPATNDQVIQGPVRNGLVLTLGLFVAWGQPLSIVTGQTTVMLGMLALKEALIGLVIGFVASVVFWIAESAGALMDNQAGYNNVQQTNPLSGQQCTPVSNLLVQLAITGFYMLGGMLVLVGLIIDSFRLLPLTDLSPPAGQLLHDLVTRQTVRYLESVAVIAAPVLLVLILVDLGIGLLGKAAQKLEPNSLGQPIKGAVTMVLLALLIAAFFVQARPQLALRDLSQQLEQLLGAAAAPRR